MTENSNFWRLSKAKGQMQYFSSLHFFWQLSFYAAIVIWIPSLDRDEKEVTVYSRYHEHIFRVLNYLEHIFESARDLFRCQFRQESLHFQYHQWLPEAWLKEQSPHTVPEGQSRHTQAGFILCVLIFVQRNFLHHKTTPDTLYHEGVTPITGHRADYPCLPFFPCPIYWKYGIYA